MENTKHAGNINKEKNYHNNVFSEQYCRGI